MIDPENPRPDLDMSAYEAAEGELVEALAPHLRRMWNAGASASDLRDSTGEAVDEFIRGLST